PGRLPDCGQGGTAAGLAGGWEPAPKCATECPTPRARWLYSCEIECEHYVDSWGGLRAAISATRVESEDSLNFTKNFLLWVVIAVILVALFNLFQGSTPRGPETSMAYSDFLQEVEKGNVESVTIQGPTITGRSKAGSFTTYAPPNDPDMVSKLIARGVKV